MVKPAKIKRGGKLLRVSDRLVDPPSGTISQLEAAACKDLRLARLTLGLYQLILGGKPSGLFLGYYPRLKNFGDFPALLRPPVRRLVEWGQAPGAVLNRLFVSQNVITEAVHAIRRESPYGQSCIKVVSKLRALYPITPGSRVLSSAGPVLLENVTILEDAVGRPLDERTMRLVQGFNPSTIQVAAYDEPFFEGWEPGVTNIRLNPDGYTVESITFTIKVERPTAKPGKIEGILFDHFETGTEGVLWALVDGENFGYDALRIIEAGDHLTILDELGRTKLWSGTIRCDRRSGWRHYPLNPKYGQPCALGYWVHWTQKGFKPDDWARFFIRPEYDRLRGVLVRKKQVMNLTEP